MPPRPRPGFRNTGRTVCQKARSADRSCGSSPSSTTSSSMFFSRAGFTKLMLSLWVDAAIIFAVVVLNALLGFIQEGRAEKALEFDPQHALRRGANRARRRDAHASCRAARSRGRRAARVGRQDSRGPAAGRSEEPAHRRGGADRRVGAGGEEHRSGVRQRDGRGPRVHGVLRHDGRVRPRDGRRRCDRQRDGARPHQPAARRTSARSKRRCCARSRNSATRSPRSSG